jgi:hypothetical protein
MPRNSDLALPSRMSVLPVAAFLILQNPSFLMKNLNQVADLHEFSVQRPPLLHPSHPSRNTKA